MADNAGVAATRWQDDVARLIEVGRDREAVALAAQHAPRPIRGVLMDPRDQLDQLLPLLDGLVEQLTPDQLRATTPCTEFAVEDVLDHMIGGATAFAGAFRGEAPQTAAPPGAAQVDRIAQFRTAMGELQGAVHSPGALERTISAPFGDVPGEAFARFVVLDGLVHGWDIATATGQRYAPDDRLVKEVDAFAREAITPDLRASGAFAAPVMPPVGASPLLQLVAFTGRRADPQS